VRYLQLASLILFYALFVGRSIDLYRRGERVFVIGKGKGGRQGLLEMSFMVGLVVWSGEILLRSLDLGVSLLPDFWSQPLFDSRLADLLGASAIVLGLSLFAVALHHFGRSWRVGIDHDRPGQLVTYGVFAITRNPIFLFMDLFFLGTALIQGDLFCLLFALAAAGGIHYQIRQEEKFLLGQYGRAYRRYMLSVPRYIGRPRWVNGVSSSPTG
jgi:protein-S-isoprenylcysteine O-methyltransferase Ste14